MPNISIYIQDEVLQRIDECVAELSATEAARGLSGYALTSRSKFIEGCVKEHFQRGDMPSISSIQYAVVQVAKEFGVAQVSLFGSYARGEETQDSDIDLLVDKGKIRGTDIISFQHALERLTGKTVDIVTTGGVQERFLKKIEKDLVPLYDAG